MRHKVKHITIDEYFTLHEYGHFSNIGQKFIKSCSNCGLMWTTMTDDKSKYNAVYLASDENQLSVDKLPSCGSVNNIRQEKNQ